MSDKNKNHEHKTKAQEAAEEMRDDMHLENPDVEVVDVEGDGDASEPLKDELAQTQDELTATRDQLEKEKKEYLFLMAEFDNYRKRVTREKADLIKNASEKVLKGLLPIVDDMERGLAADATSEDAKAVHEGMTLIYNKLVKYLADNGVKAMESTGQPFDAEQHEAIATVPAPSEDMKGKVLDTTTTGYTLNDKVLRHAKVVVAQ